MWLFLLLSLPAWKTWETKTRLLKDYVQEREKKRKIKIEVNRGKEIQRERQKSRDIWLIGKIGKKERKKEED